MKKIMFLTAIILFMGTSTNAQEKKIQNNKKFFLSISAGPSFPVSAFASKDTSNNEAGFAKTGINMNLHFGYQLHENFGIVSTFLYSYHKLDISGFKELGVSTDHWQYYGVLIGPMFTLPIGEKVKVDFKTLGGITNVNSPDINTTDGSVYIKEDWSTSFVIQVGADFRYNFTKNLYMITNVDYNYMKPKFNLTIPEGDGYLPHLFEQKMSIVNLNVGIGVNF